jgi:CBS domain-containing protein
MNALLPLLVATVIAHGFTVLTLKRSILTEKVARRGFHLSREYSVDPLEVQFVREVMRTNLAAFSGFSTLADVAASFRPDHGPKGQHLYPIVDGDRRLLGVITRKRLKKLLDEAPSADMLISESAMKEPVVAYAGEPLRVVVNRMAETGRTRMPVIEPSPERRLVGMVSLEDLLRARTRNLSEERTRERVLRIRLPFGAGRTTANV